MRATLVVVTAVSESKKGKPRVTLAAATAWAGDTPIHFDPKTLGPYGGDSSLASLHESAPVWLDLHLKGVDACEWLEPWDRPTARPVDWSAIEPVADALGFAVPAIVAADDPVAVGLERLVRINEIGVLRWLGRRLGELDEPYVAAPLLGMIPTSSIDELPPSDAPLEIVLLRVNLLVLERRALMFTIRLPDRLASGSARDYRRHCPAEDRVPNELRPDLTVFGHHLPPSGRPSARDLGDALALYLTATCWSAAEHGREALDEVERSALRRTSGGDDAERRVEELDTQADGAVRLCAALQQTEEELMRVLQRLSEREPGTRVPTAVRSRYERALEQLGSVHRDVRSAMDALTVRSAESQREVAKTRERRQESAQAVLAAVGTVVIVPSLVAALYSDKVKLAGDNAGVGQVRMILLMVGTVLLGFGLVFATMRSGLGDILGRIRAAGRPAIAMVTAGLAVRVATALSLLVV